MTRVYTLVDTTIVNAIHVADQEVKANLANPAAAATLASGNYGGCTAHIAFSFVTQSGEPNTAAWPTGPYECRFNVSDVGGGMSYGLLTLGGSEGHFGRVNDGISSEVEVHEQAESAFTGVGVKTATYSGTWGGSVAGDRFECLIAGRRDVNHGNESITITLNDSGNSVCLGAWAAADGLNLVEVINETENIPEALTKASGINRIINEIENIGVDVLDLQVEANEDDVHHNSVHSINQFNIQAGLSAGIQFGSAFRFTRVTIPQSSVIDVAHFILTPNVTESGTVVRTNIQAHDDDASPQVTNDTEWHDIVDANLTSALIAWDGLNTWTIDIEEQSPSIVPIVQEIINRPGFNKVLHIFWLNDGSTDFAIRAAYQHDDDFTKAPKLHIEFTPIKPRIVKVLGIVRILDETINIQEGIIFITAVGGAALVEVIGETIEINEGNVKSLSIARVIDETENIQENTIRILILVRVFNETEDIIESIVKAAILTRIVDETEDINEGLVKSLALLRITDEVININEGTIQALGKVQIVDETVDISEGAFRILSLIKVIDETENIPEGNLRILDIIRIINETENIPEGITKTFALIRVLDETINILEEPVKVSALIRVFDETINITEAVLNALGKVQVVDEVINVPEGTLRILNLVRIDDDTVEISETLVKLQDIVRAINENENIEEGSIRTRTLLRLINETEDIAETFIKVSALTRLINEIINILESTIVTRALLRILNETVNIIEGIVRVLSIPIVGLQGFLTAGIQINSAFNAGIKIASALLGGVKINDK